MQLREIDLPINVLQCTDMLCADKHKHDLETFHNKLINSCMNSAEQCIPLSKTYNDKSNIIPGWDKEITVLREKSLFWHMIWKESGKPEFGLVTDIMKTSRHIYHYKLRYLKRNRKRIIQNRIGEALSSEKSNDFWQEVKRIKGSNRTISCIIDDADRKHDIANIFADKYKIL